LKAEAAMLEFINLLSAGLGCVVGAALGLGVAALLHWLIPGLGEQVTFLDGFLVLGGFCAGLWIEHFRKEK
jgi:hypothetical protein